MELEAISGATTVALTSAIFFLLIAKTWSAISRTVSSSPLFSDQIMHEAAQRFRDELKRLKLSQATYLAATLVFFILFAAAYELRAQDLFSGYPSWHLQLQLGFFVLASGFAAYLIGRTMLARHRVEFLRNASVAVGHQLQNLSNGLTRVYHDVATSAGVVDHVIIGQTGLFAVNVVAQRTGKRNGAKLEGHTISFSDDRADVSIVDLGAKTRRLEKEFGMLLGRSARVRSVVALPGWDIHEQTGIEHLLVNEQTLGMLIGWRDDSDNLLNEEVDILKKELTARCSLS